jgi:NAD+ kinase
MKPTKPMKPTTSKARAVAIAKRVRQPKTRPLRVQVVGLQRKSLIAYLRKQHPGLTVVDRKPDLIICFGGDGTLLYGERMHPGIPKVLLRNSLICQSCAQLVKETIPRLLLEGSYRTVKHRKLEGAARGKSRLALNDIVVAHPNVNGTLRSRVVINGRQYGDEVLGDGIVVSTPIGSTGYFQSITRSNFQTGIAVAFNNSVNIVNHVVLPQDSRIQVEITRGPGVLAADNDESQVALSTGDTVEIRLSAATAELVVFPREYDRFNLTVNTNRVPLGFCQICRQHYGR